MHALALLPEQPRLLGRALDIARKFLTRQVTPDDTDAAIAEREHQTSADDAEHHALEIAKIGNNEHYRYGKRPVHPGGALRGRSRDLGEEHGSDISKHAAEYGFRH